MLKKLLKLFDGGLGKLDMETVLITLKECSKPYQERYFNIPQAYNKSARGEVERLVAIDVLEKLRYNTDSLWATPTFTQPKKTNNIRILNNFQKFSKYIEQKPFSLLRIGKAIQKVENFTTTTAIDFFSRFFSHFV